MAKGKSAKRSDSISGRSGTIINEASKSSQKSMGILKNKIKSAKPSLHVGQKKGDSRNL